MRADLKVTRFLICFQLLVVCICIPPAVADGSNRWAVGFGTGYITQIRPHGMLYGEFARVNGDLGGRLYHLNVNYRLKSKELHLFSTRCRVDYEITSTVGFVEENNGKSFANINSAFALRWMTFPWNRYITTTAMTGLGLNYSADIFSFDIEEHRGQHRSRLKFFWPLEVTFALPGWEHHQLVLFNHHISGGYTLDTGGIDNYGFGYRYLF
ncbi:MAG: hypothetical protein D3926_24880 [Desulfobacteraceae bacterium]|nr:MAG: hypothetical protein D3926_24880 [Desulfobacteraceae bacterium]